MGDWSNLFGWRLKVKKKLSNENYKNVPPDDTLRYIGWAIMEFTHRVGDNRVNQVK